MNPSIDRWAGTGFVDYESTDGRIRVREEPRGEVFRMTSAEYWHLNQAFHQRSLFFGSGIKPFIDPIEQYLILRDAGVILLFDYSTGQAWHAESPWGHQAGVEDFPEIEFSSDAILIGRFKAKVPRDQLDHFFLRGLGRFQDGFLTHWRPSTGQDSEYSKRLKGVSALLETQ